MPTSRTAPPPGSQGARAAAPPPQCATPSPPQSKGDYEQGKDKVPAELGPDSPTIRVKGVALMGSVQVVRLPPPGTRHKFIGTY
jgi:hypothetical protein